MCAAAGRRGGDRELPAAAPRGGPRRAEPELRGRADPALSPRSGILPGQGLGRGPSPLGFLLHEMGTRKPPPFTAEGTEGDAAGKAPSTGHALVRRGQLSPRGRGRGRRRARVGAGGGGRQTGTRALGGRGRGAPWQPPRPSWCRSPAGSEQGSEEDTPGPRLQAAAEEPGHPAPPRTPALPHPLTYRPSRALQRSRLSHGWPPGRPWKLRPAGTTSGPADASLAVCVGAGQRPRMIGWRHRNQRNAPWLPSASRTASRRTERFRCVW